MSPVYFETRQKYTQFLLAVGAKHEPTDNHTIVLESALNNALDVIHLLDDTASPLLERSIIPSLLIKFDGYNLQDAFDCVITWLRQDAAFERGVCERLPFRAAFGKNLDCLAEMWDAISATSDLGLLVDLLVLKTILYGVLTVKCLDNKTLANDDWRKILQLRDGARGISKRLLNRAYRCLQHSRFTGTLNEVVQFARMQCRCLLDIIRNRNEFVIDDLLTDRKRQITQYFRELEHDPGTPEEAHSVCVLRKHLLLLMIAEGNNLGFRVLKLLVAAYPSPATSMSRIKDLETKQNRFPVTFLSDLPFGRPKRILESRSNGRNVDFETTAGKTVSGYDLVSVSLQNFVSLNSCSHNFREVTKAIQAVEKQKSKVWGGLHSLGHTIVHGELDHISQLGDNAYAITLGVDIIPDISSIRFSNNHVLLLEVLEIFRWRVYRDFDVIPPNFPRGSLLLTKTHSLDDGHMDAVYRARCISCILQAGLNSVGPESDLALRDAVGLVDRAFAIEHLLRIKSRSIDAYYRFVDRGISEEIWMHVLTDGGYKSPEEYSIYMPNTLFQRVSNSTVILQALFRGALGRQAAKVLHQEKVVPKIQAICRLFLARRRHGEAVDNVIARLFLMAQRIQSRCRGFLVRSRYGTVIDSLPFIKEWHGCFTDNVTPFSWERLKAEEIGTAQAFEDLDNECDETSRLISEAFEVAMQPSEGLNEDSQNGNASSNASTSREVNFPRRPPLITRNTQVDPRVEIHSIKLTHSAVKWFKGANPKYQDMFCRRISQLASNERSRILKKHLTGCRHAIWETYLDQATAQRLLWTECRDSSGRTSILVWYVAKHKWVSRYISLIDKAETRLDNQSFRESGLLGKDGSMPLESDTVLIDPLGNTPLWIHEVPLNKVYNMATEDWTPPLRLTDTERKVVQAAGTVLLLGRSGTGKTVCICNRIAYDLENRGKDDHFRQLFISRSTRLCKMVETLVENSIDKKVNERNTSFFVFGAMIEHLNETLDDIGHGTTIRPGASRFDFRHFKQFIEGSPQMQIEALVIWTQIRSYIKGSIEALVKGSWLSRAEYLKLGKNRCRLSPSQRNFCFDTFERYKELLKTRNGYDDCDVISDVLQRLSRVSLENRLENGLIFDNLYVDEVQDFTQAEIALFWKLCEGRSLFLAGDTAQSVVQGVSFRFDEVRSVASALCGDRRDRIPSRPFVLNINFRSHSGILDIAALTLQLMYDMFPGSTNKADPEKGLFCGPRPSFIAPSDFDEKGLQQVLEMNPGTVVLTQSSEIRSVREIAGSSNVPVLSIVDAKGLDFEDTLIVNFFCGLSKKSQKAWVKMLRTADGPKSKAADENTSPELEMQLKLLYTAITRCRNRLFFLETRPSSVGDKFFRMLLSKSLVDKQKIRDLHSGLKSPAEWLAQAIEFAMNAESSADESRDVAQTFSAQAQKCFVLAGKSDLAEKASRQWMGLELMNSIRDIDDGETAEETLDELMARVPCTAACVLKEGFVELAEKLCLAYADASKSKRTQGVVKHYLLRKIHALC